MHLVIVKTFTVRLSLSRVRTIWYAGGMNEEQLLIHTERVDDTTTGD